jgi:ribosome biogenesis GTPase / thiamine phosphate phosphatase
VFSLPDSITIDTPNTQVGVVFKKFIGAYHVEVNGELVICSISSRLRKHLIYPEADRSSIGYHKVIEVKDIKMVDPVAIGDYVAFRPAEAGKGMITDILPRRTKLSRPDPGPKPLEQVVVANLDQVVAVFAAARPAPKWNLLDRYLVSAESSELEPIICITKMDIGDAEEIDMDMALFRKLGYRVILTSSENGDGIEELRDALAGKLSVCVGKSGVGKTSLLNAMQPGLGAKIGAVGKGALGKGKHTTTHMEMFPLDAGGGIVDTPGMRVFGLWEVDGSDIALYFREMRPFLDHCQFRGNCTHEHEPGCAVIDALDNGLIDARRYESYRRMLNGKLE